MRADAMLEAALEEAIVGKRTHCQLEFMAATAGADAERAQIVAWLRDRADVLESRNDYDLSVEAGIALELADAIESGQHWRADDDRA